MTRERPILFSGAMVRALLAGTKTQTRRIVKATPSCRDADRAVPALLVRRGEHGGSYVVLDDEIGPAWSPAGGMPLEPYRWHAQLSPYGEPGDHLWVKETWRAVEREGGIDGVRYAADGAFVSIPNTKEAADRWCTAYDNGRHGANWRPSIFMPRWASRITLAVTDVRCERLQSISEDDARAEGIDPNATIPARINGDLGEVRCFGPDAARKAFALLWDGINGERAPWSSNPWVWVIGLRREASS